MSNLIKKIANHNIRKKRVRAKVFGTSERPRLSVSISNTHVSAQIIDDSKSVTLAYSTTVGSKIVGCITEKARFIGSDIGKKATKLKIKTVVFDRNGRQYANRLSALAEAARKEGLVF